MEQAPEQNYAREMMELFTLGVGNYTENDIKQAALAFTGWRVSGLNATFNQSRFANVNKTFFGKTGNYKHGEIIDIILEKPEATNMCAVSSIRSSFFTRPMKPL